MSGDVRGLRIGEFACRAGVSVDTIRYYERLGLLLRPERTEGGYRQYGPEALGRLLFIRRAKLLGLSLSEIRELLGVADEGECQPLRGQVARLLRQKIAECETQLAELAAFKTNLDERYRLALSHQDEPAGGCANFPATCGCLPVQPEELAQVAAESDSRARSCGAPR